MNYLDYLRSLEAWRIPHDPKPYYDIAGSRPIFDEAFIDKWIDDPLYIERLILNHVVETFHLSVYFEFILGNGNDSNALSYKRTDGTASALFLDKVLDFSIMEVFLTVWAAEYKPQYFDKCKKRLEDLIINKLVKRENANDDRMDIIQETQMPDKAVVQAFDMYWAAWTFVVGHELFHIVNREKLSKREEEFRADRFGFQVLIRLIEEQKAGVIPEGLDCFYEEYYLVPCMLMYIFRALDMFRTDHVRYGGDAIHPSPEERMQAIIDLYDIGDIPDDMDTTNGNAFLSTFLDRFDELIGEI